MALVRTSVSAYGAKLLGLPGTAEYDSGSDTFSFPGGNAATLRHIVKAMLPDAITGIRSFADVLFAPINFKALDRSQNTPLRLEATVVAVRHEGPPQTRLRVVDVTYAVGGELSRVRGKGRHRGSRWLDRTSYCARPPPAYVAAYAQFHHGPIFVANVAVHNWKAFAKLGIAAAHWFDGFGFFVNLRQPMKIDGAPVPLDRRDPRCLRSMWAFRSRACPSIVKRATGAAAVRARATRISSYRFASNCNKCWASADSMPGAT